MASKMSVMLCVPVATRLSAHAIAGSAYDGGAAPVWGLPVRSWASASMVRFVGVPDAEACTSSTSSGHTDTAFFQPKGVYS